MSKVRGWNPSPDWMFSNFVNFRLNDVSRPYLSSQVGKNDVSRRFNSNFVTRCRFSGLPFIAGDHLLHTHWNAFFSRIRCRQVISCWNHVRRHSKKFSATAFANWYKVCRIICIRIHSLFLMRKVTYSLVSLNHFDANNTLECSPGIVKMIQIISKIYYQRNRTSSYNHDWRYYQ